MPTQLTVGQGGAHGKYVHVGVGVWVHTCINLGIYSIYTVILLTG